MAVGIYKQGQGYWTRVMTAIGAGVLGLSGAAWLWGEMAAIRTSFNQIYLQAGVAAVVALLTVVIVYWLVGIKKSTVEFFIATEGEMQKVNWSTRREVIGSTWVVLGVSVVIALILFITDLLFANFFRMIDVLES